MKPLENATLQELRDEIARREAEISEGKEPLEKLYIGIHDYYGVESLIEIKDAKEFAKKYSSLELRVRFNSGRGATLYSVKLPFKLAEAYNQQMLEGKFLDVAESLKSLPTYQKI